MFFLSILVELIVAFLLIVVILLQSSKGGGLAGSFGGGQVGTVFGVRRTADFLSRATTILATTFIVLSLIINIFFVSSPTSNIESVIQRGTPSAVPTPLPPRSLPAAAPTQTKK